MKKQLYEILRKVQNGEQTLEDAQHQLLHLFNVSVSLPPVLDAVTFARWVRNNTTADGSPKLYLNNYEKYNKDKCRYTIEELYEMFKGGYER